MENKSIREKCLPYNELTLRRLAITATVMYIWILLWALLFKLGNENLLVNNYANLKDMTVMERIMWDIVPFNYRGEGLYKTKIIMDTVMNCFVFAPLGVALGYLFKKTNVLRDVAICLGFSFAIETIQLMTMLGNFATEDLITNTVGYFIGFVIYRIGLARLSVKHSVIFLGFVNVAFFAIVFYSCFTTVSSAETIFKILTHTL